MESGKTFKDDRKTTTANRRLAKKRVKWLIEHSSSHQSRKFRDGILTVLRSETRLRKATERSPQQKKSDPPGRFFHLKESNLSRLLNRQFHINRNRRRILKNQEITIGSEGTAHFGAGSIRVHSVVRVGKTVFVHAQTPSDLFAAQVPISLLIMFFSI
jgi:hypothetical protein